MRFIFMMMLLGIVNPLHPFLFVDFDISMRTNKYQHIITRSVQNEKLLSFFRQQYQRYERSITLADEHRLRIPKIMHHIWFGVPFSVGFKELRQTWFDAHPDWIFIFWTDRPENDIDAHCVKSFQELDEILKHNKYRRIVVDVHELLFNNRSFFDKAKNYGERSDILKWEVVHRYGGTYVDTDFECYYPLDRLNELFDFYTGLQPLDTGHVQLGAALFAARPQHPILARCVSDIHPGKGPIIIRTGPIHFTNCLIKEIRTSLGRNIVLPASYFYPCGYEQQKMPSSVWKEKESYAVHHWAGSWLKSEGNEK